MLNCVIHVLTLYTHSMLAGQISATEALRTACEDIKDASSHTLTTFREAVKKAKREGKDKSSLSKKK